MTSDNLRTICLAFFVFSIWLIARPYTGVWHDGMLYLLQGLRLLHPELFTRDLFFFADSQARYSAFPNIYAFWLNYLGVERAGVLLMFFAGLAFYLAVLVTFSRILPNRMLWLGMLALGVFPHLYGANQTFAFAEPFLTARSWAEPFCLLGLAAAISGRLTLAFVSLAVAFLLHPLVAMPGLLVLMILLVLGDRRLAVLPVFGMLITLLLWGFNAGPFADLFRKIDAIWINALAPDPTLFLSQWSPADWNVVLFDLAVLFISLNYLHGQGRQLIYAVLLATGVSLLTTAVVADGMKLLFPTQMQFWRTLWISHCCAMVLVPWLYFELRSRDKESVGVFLVLALVTISYPGAAVASGVALILNRQATLFTSRSVGAKNFRWVLYFVTGIAAVVPLISVVGYAIDNPQLGLLRQISVLFSVPAMAFVLSLSCYALLFKRSLFLWISSALLTLGVAMHLWDARTDNFRREIEAYSEIVGIFPQVGHGQQVFWYDQPMAVWMLIKSPSYFSYRQCAGAIYSRDTTQECSRRATILKRFDMMHAVCEEQAARLDKEVVCLPSAAMIHQICRELHDLDFMILEGDVAGWSEAKWSPKRAHHRSYHLHRCSLIRQAAEPIER